MNFVTNSLLGNGQEEAKAVLQTELKPNSVLANPQEGNEGAGDAVARQSTSKENGELVANNRSEVNYLKHKFKTGIDWLDEKIKNDTVTDMDAIVYEYLTGSKLWDALRTDRNAELAIQQRLDSNVSKNKAEDGVGEAISALQTIKTFKPYAKQGGVANTLARGFHTLTRGLSPISQANADFKMHHDTMLKQIVALTNAGRARGLSVQEMQEFQKKFGSAIVRSNKELKAQYKYGLNLGVQRLKQQISELEKHGGAATRKQHDILKAFERELKEL